MTDLHKLSREHALSLESLLVRHDVGAAVFFYNIDCRYLASSNTPLYYSDILLYLYYIVCLLHSLLVKPAPSLPRLFDQSCVNHQKPSEAPVASSTFAKMVCCKEDLVKIVYNYGAARRFGLRQSL